MMVNEPQFDIGKDERSGDWSGHGEYRNQSRLESCPFCGSANIVVENTHTPYYTAECDDCGAQGPHSGPTSTGGDHHIRSRKKCEQLHREAMQNAIEAWNDRH